MILYFGRHRGKAVSDPSIDPGYLAWALRTVKLSGAMQTAIAEELTARGCNAPEPPAWVVSPCHRCGDTDSLGFWMQDRRGLKRIRLECATCSTFLGFPPSRPPFSDLADLGTSKTAALDALLWLEGLGIEPRSDGVVVEFGWEEYLRMPPALRRLVRQCRFTLGRMIGKTAPAAAEPPAGKWPPCPPGLLASEPFQPYSPPTQESGQ
jgi:hypothetical protein